MEELCEWALDAVAYRLALFGKLHPRIILPVVGTPNGFAKLVLRLRRVSDVLPSDYWRL